MEMEFRKSRIDVMGEESKGHAPAEKGSGQAVDVQSKQSRWREMTR